MLKVVEPSLLRVVVVREVERVVDPSALVVVAVVDGVVVVLLDGV